MQVVGQKVNEFVDNVGGEITGFMGGLFSAVTFGVVDAVLDTGTMEEERKERLFEDVDVVSSRSFRRPRHTSLIELVNEYRRRVVKEIDWNTYVMTMHQMLHDWMQLQVRTRRVWLRCVLVTIVNGTENQSIQVNVGKTIPRPKVEVPSIETTILSPRGGGSGSRGSSGGVGGWSPETTMTLLFGDSGSSATDPSSSSSSSAAAAASATGQTHLNTGPKMGVKLCTNLFQFKLFPNGAALILPVSTCTVSVAARRQFHDFVEMTLIVEDVV